MGKPQVLPRSGAPKTVNKGRFNLITLIRSHSISHFCLIAISSTRASSSNLGLRSQQDISNERCGRISRKQSGQLANLRAVPTYAESLNTTSAQFADPLDQSRSPRRSSIAKSARYPRVAVLLGVSHRWYIPLLLCRSLSITSAIWWACCAVYAICSLPNSKNDGDDRVDVFGTRVAIAQIVLSFLWVSI